MTLLIMSSGHGTIVLQGGFGLRRHSDQGSERDTWMYEKEKKRKKKKEKEKKEKDKKRTQSPTGGGSIDIQRVLGLVCWQWCWLYSGC